MGLNTHAGEDEDRSKALDSLALMSSDLLEAFLDNLNCKCACMELCYDLEGKLADSVLRLEIMVLTFHQAPENLGLHFC